MLLIRLAIEVYVLSPFISLLVCEQDNSESVWWIFNESFEWRGFWSMACCYAGLSVSCLAKSVTIVGTHCVYPR